ncbi:hypothetical protein C6497_06960 [Candidatus Poribacteria bacterium]|nr:MAG: hypothetical protein C6497_06960 [Candidatus Poribacteria bacterium]
MKLLKPLFIFCLVLFLPTLAIPKIVFISKREGGNNIYVMDDDGSGLQRLTFTQPPQWDAGPVWSPDGKRIAFFRNISKIPTRQIPRLFIIDQDGSNEQQIIDDWASNCSWAPDGRHIAFGGDSNIYVVDIITREIQQLTNNQDLGEWATAPAWSPNGKYIAYRHRKPPNGATTICVMNADGTRQHQLIPGDEWNRFPPRWSSDSKSVLYFEVHADPDLGFWKVSNNVVIQGRVLRNRRILKIPEKWRIHSVCWFDNDKQVLIAAREFDAVIHRQIDIYKYNLGNNQITNLTNDPKDDLAPNWISDNILSVSPEDKKGIQWGKVKSLLKTVDP